MRDNSENVTAANIVFPETDGQLIQLRREEERVQGIVSQLEDEYKKLVAERTALLEKAQDARKEMRRILREEEQKVEELYALYDECSSREDEKSNELNEYRNLLKKIREEIEAG